jgi:hypothetical protein
VVARSLPRRLPGFRMVSPGLGRNADCNLAPKTLHFKACRAFDLQNLFNEIDWMIQGLLRRASA